MMLNPWLESTLKKARSTCEDVDRKTFAKRLFLETIARVHHIATVNAHATHPPDIERFQNDEMVLLSMEWYDKSSGWSVCFGVRRKLGEKPHTMLSFSGVIAPVGCSGYRGQTSSIMAVGNNYDCDKPTDEDIRKALHDYFQAWRTE